MRVSTVLMATVFGMALGGWMSGVIFDLTGSYHAAFLNGIGVLEMVRLALRDPTALGGVDGQKLPDLWAQRLRQRHPLYALDFAEYPMKLRCVRDTHPPSHAGQG